MFFRPLPSARGTGLRSICRATSRCPTTKITLCLRISEKERKRSVRKKILICLLLMALSVGTAYAQFGFGGIVYDPTNYHNALLRYFQLQQQLVELRNSYAQLVSQYNLALQMAKNLQNMPTRYRTQFSQWRNGVAVDTYSNTTGWINGANSGLLPTVMAGYQQATTRLGA